MPEKIYWEGLLNDIAVRKCVLLIGPYFTTVAGQPMSRYVRERLKEVGGDEIAYDYAADDLFLFKSEEAKLNCARRVKKIYRGITPPDELLAKILQIPFPLIISLNPDKFLPSYCLEHGIAYHFSFMKINGEAMESIPEPTPESTIIYNLCGCIDDDESLVLDYEDLFKLLKTALSDTGLPDRVRTMAQRAQTFLFLGFQFEKWYSQLLLQLLTGQRKKSSKIAIDTAFANDDSHNFVVRQFSIKFMGDGAAFFEALYGECKTSDMVTLRPIQIPSEAIHSPEWDNSVQLLENMLAEADFDPVFEQLKALTTGTRFGARSLQLQSRYKVWKKDKIAYLLDSRDESRLLNLLIVDTSELLSELRHA